MNSPTTLHAAANDTGFQQKRESMKWQQLLCADRLGKTKRGALDAARSEFRRDSDRITFTTAFRRLQDKTQVFPLADNDYVRTRLTHSLEVASVGRSLGARVGAALVERNGLDRIHGSDFGEIVSAAALAHDLGNPPFGHSGEDAIRHWFKTSLHAARAAEDFTAAQRADVGQYEGNAQGFRLLTRLQMPDNEGGLQLTHATLGAFTKYPRESVLGVTIPPAVGRIIDPGYSGASGKKFGIFQSEREHFASVAEHCGLLSRSLDVAWWSRHPLAFLVEAADDICYRLVDFEDGFRTGHLRYKEVREAFSALMPVDKYPARSMKRAHSDVRRVQILRATTIGAAIDDAADAFLANESGLLDGTFDQPLIDAGARSKAWGKIQKRSIDTIYSTARGVEIEAAGFEVLGGLLDIFVSALNDVAAERKGASPRSHKLLLLVPDENLGRKRRPEKDPYLRLLKILDFVSGMTDTYAVTLYKKVRGISLGTKVGA